MAAKSVNLGFPRIGPQRELKKALEGFWSGKSSAADLEGTANVRRRENWLLQRQHGMDNVPCNDFSLYDHVLDAAVMVGAVPDRYRDADGEVSLASYFAMARGGELQGKPVVALEMTKWFDTNYHYIVPELAAAQQFHADPRKPVLELAQARELGLGARPVLLGPISFLLLSKTAPGTDPLALVDDLTDVYQQLLVALAAAGAEWAQLDEPMLNLDQPPEVLARFPATYRRLTEAAPALKILLGTYFSGLRRNLPTALNLPVAAVHLDLVHGPEDFGPALELAPDGLSLSLGVVDGRNIWRSDLDQALARLEQAKNRLGSDRALVAPSCSLLHLPVDLEHEGDLAPDLRSWLAFAVQRLDEVDVLVRALNEGRDAVAGELEASAKAAQERARSAKTNNPALRARLDRLADGEEGALRRQSPYPSRHHEQARRLGLPPVATTTIGSFPQTPELRRARAQARRGELSDQEYESVIAAYITDAVKRQEDIGLDVLVHGEPERNDMVEYFAEQLDGYAFTANGWVQSYGSRCVKPPVLFGDVRRARPMTVPWAKFAQSLTTRPVKGMLTGPVTMLQWSFARVDQPRRDTCLQLALAIRDEVIDLEAAGMPIIQVDEPGLREGLPLHAEDRGTYLAWAVEAFCLATAGVRDDTQVHTHMCYAHFDQIIEAVAAMDADVISFESARAGVHQAAEFIAAGYPNEVGPGIWDVHSPRVPSVEELTDALDRLVEIVPVERLWANPDCGLKTRAWDEVVPALRNLVAAAGAVRRDR